MKKILLIAVMVCGFGSVANAASSFYIGVLESSITVRVVSISSSVATSVSGSTIEMPNRTSLVLQNIDSTYDVNCAEDSALIATHYFIVPAGGGSISLNIRTYSAKEGKALKIYCMTTKTTGATNLSVIQAY